MMLLESELDSYVTNPDLFVPVIAARLAEYGALFEIEPPFIIDADPDPSRRGRAGLGPVLRRRDQARCCGVSAVAPASTRAALGSCSTWMRHLPSSPER